MDPGCVWGGGWQGEGSDLGCGWVGEGSNQGGFRSGVCVGGEGSDPGHVEEGGAVVVW